MCAKELYTPSGVNPREGEPSIRPPSSQRGFLAAKFLIGSILSLVVSALAVLAYNGDTLWPQRYSALDHELNLAMELMRRDISRNPVPIVISKDNECIIFEFDRDEDGMINPDEVGAYRHEMIGGIGVIALWMGEGEPDCRDPDPWAPVSDASVIDIDAFTVSEDPDSGGGATFSGESDESASAATRRIRLELSGSLVRDADASEALHSTVEVQSLLWL